jgi:hypothetical protein
MADPVKLSGVGAAMASRACLPAHACGGGLSN